MTILVDDAGTGDILWGIVIGAYRPESDEFVYDLVDVSFFKRGSYENRKYIEEVSRIVLKLVDKLNPTQGEQILVCQGDILNEAAKALVEKYGEALVRRARIEGRAQELVEGAYIDELKNVGYDPIPDRMNRWGKSFWHMYEWVREDKTRIRWVKTGYPNLKRYKLFALR